MSELKIEDNVPIPPRRRGRCLSMAAQVVMTLKPGQSVLVPRSAYKNPSKLMSYAAHKFNGEREFTSRSESGGVRIWRVK